MRVLIYSLDKYNLQTRIASFPDHEKLLNEIVVRLELFMIVNTWNPQMEHCPCPKYDMIYSPDMYNLQVRRNYAEK